MSGRHEQPLLIAPRDATFYRYTNESCLDAADIYNELANAVGCSLKESQREDYFPTDTNRAVISNCQPTINDK